MVGVIAVFIFGPDRLPQLAENAAKLVKRVRQWVDDTQKNVSDEFGEDFSIDDWRKLDPRQYDPRRIVRDAWKDAGSSQSLPTGKGNDATGNSETAVWADIDAQAKQLVPGSAPFDTEAT